jgi:hypothetical protein
MPPVNSGAGPAVKQPTAGTLKKYGLSVEEWRAILRRQGGRCAICRRLPKSGRLAIDHQHVPKWRKMKPEERKQFVRGLCCFLCNGKCVSKWVTLERAQNIVAYLEAYGSRRLKEVGL